MQGVGPVQRLTTSLRSRAMLSLLFRPLSYYCLPFASTQPSDSPPYI